MFFQSNSPQVFGEGHAGGLGWNWITDDDRALGRWQAVAVGRNLIHIDRIDLGRCPLLCSYEVMGLYAVSSHDYALSAGIPLCSHVQLRLLQWRQAVSQQACSRRCMSTRDGRCARASSTLAYRDDRLQVFTPDGTPGPGKPAL